MGTSVAPAAVLSALAIAIGTCSCASQQQPSDTSANSSQSSVGRYVDDAALTT